MLNNQEISKLVDDELNNSYIFKQKRKEGMTYILIIAILFAVFIFSLFFLKVTSPYVGAYKYIGMVLGIVLIIFFIKAIRVYSVYTTEFNQNVLPKLIKRINEELNFNANSGITQKEYVDTGLATIFDTYDNYNCIYGNVKENVVIKLSDVYTKMRVKTKNGSYLLPVFTGIVSICTLCKFTNGEIKLKFNELIKIQKRKLVNLESMEFEKIFDLIADDRVTAMQVFTADMMENILAICKKYGLRFELSVISNKLNILFYISRMYKVSMFKSQPSELKKYIRTIQAIIEINMMMKEKLESVLD